MHRRDVFAQETGTDLCTHPVLEGAALCAVQCRMKFSVLRVHHLDTVLTLDWENGSTLPAF